MNVFCVESEIDGSCACLRLVLALPFLFGPVVGDRQWWSRHGSDLTSFGVAVSVWCCCYVGHVCDRWL